MLPTPFPPSSSGKGLGILHRARLGHLNFYPHPNRRLVGEGTFPVSLPTHYTLSGDIFVRGDGNEAPSPLTPAAPDLSLKMSS